MNYSLLIPTYRRPESLAATLKSVFTLLDEGPHKLTDVWIKVTGLRAGSLNEHCYWLVSKLVDRGLRVEVWHNFEGLAQAKNSALDNCESEWLLVVDDDVVLNREYVGRLCSIAAQCANTQVMAVTGTVLTPFEAGYKEWSLEKRYTNLQGTDTHQIMKVAEDGEIDWGNKVQVYRYGAEMICRLGYFIGGAVLLRKGDGLRFDVAFGKIVYGEEIDYSLQIGWAGGVILFAAGAECLHFPCPTGGSKPVTEAELIQARQENFDYILSKWGLCKNPAKGFEARDAKKTLAC